MTLRGVAPHDRAALLDLWVAAWTTAMPSIDFEARRSWFETHLGNLEAAGATTLVALGRHDQLLGFVTCEAARHYLDQLAVVPAAQGTGLATKLVDAAKNLSPARLELHVNQDNPRAVRFYAREGFAILGAGQNRNSRLATWHMAWPA